MYPERGEPATEAKVICVVCPLVAATDSPPRRTGANERPLVALIELSGTL
ncbi:unannotated protein [freshwater metagenome]|uniref:Unannotated protein n=1 Tax=freshwater metagenome TaxID=449393 RepID=A0A6J7DCM1_9ZZZZ